tara:strand:- start:4262 stop:4456 length:195 start_codon:yes stop_codon:yes gene_type:complete
MGKIVDTAQSFLDNGGKSLGYDIGNLPVLNDLDVVLQYGIWIWEYNGMTEEEYYSIDPFEGKTL